MKTLDELEQNTVSQNATKVFQKPKPTCQQSIKPGHYKNHCRQIEKQEKQPADTKNSPGSNNSEPTNSDSSINNKNGINDNKNDRKPRTVHPPCEIYGETNHSTERCCIGANAAKRQAPGTEDGQSRTRSDKMTSKLKKKRDFTGCSPTLKSKMVNLYYGLAIERPETTRTVFLPIPEVVCQQPLVTFLETSKLVLVIMTLLMKQPKIFTRPNEQRELMWNHKRCN